MATSSTVSSLLLPSTLALTPLKHHHQNQITLLPKPNHQNNTRRFSSFRVQAAKLPSGVVVPKVEPKFKPPFIGFTRVAETWNARACMIGLIGIFIVELILGKGILQVIGLDIGKGLDLPL